MSSGGAEAAAPLISHYLYGEKDGSKLTAEQKETVAAITGLLGVASGAAVGSNATDAVQGGLNAEGAVENNYLTSKQLIEIDKAYYECGNDEICKQQIIDSAKILSQEQDTRLTLAKIKCAAGFCDDLNAMNKQWVHSLGIHNVVRELKKHNPNASYQELMNAAKVYIAEADSSYNQGTTRFITGALNDSPALGLAGSAVSQGLKIGVNTALTGPVGRQTMRGSIGFSAQPTGWISRDVWKSLSPNIRTKFENAISKGIVASKGQQGVIVLSKTEPCTTRIYP